MPDRITRLSIAGMRTLAGVDLALDGLSVLIGENGAGKSTIVEACEILRLASSGTFVEQLYQFHDGPGALLRHGSTRLKLGIRLEGGDEPIEYGFEFERRGDGVGIADEWLELPALPGQGSGRRLIVRNHAVSKVHDVSRGLVDVPVDDQRLALTAFGVMPPHPAFARVAAALSSVSVHLPFDTTPQWAARRVGRQTPLREPATLQRRDSLSLLGVDLALAYHTLRNELPRQHWEQTLLAVRMGLGHDVDDVVSPPGASGGSIGIAVRYRTSPLPIPGFALSDGTLAFLAFVALFRLPRDRALVVFDEPETHLHPELLMRVLGFFEAMSADHPVVLATHSDRLLDGLTAPADSVVLCALDRDRATQLVRPDAEELARWADRYRGIGDIRAAGHAASVMRRTVP